jgi:hypothetical protein
MTENLYWQPVAVTRERHARQRTAPAPGVQ